MIIKKPSYTVYSKVALIFLIAIMEFLLARLGLLLLYSSQFKSLDSLQLIGAFIEGVRFDLSSITVFFSIPLLLLALPFAFFRGRIWQGIWTWLMFAILLVMIGILMGDIVYFDFVKRHTAHELLAFGEGDANLLGGMLFGVFLPYLLAFILNSAVIFFFWLKVARMRLDQSRLRMRQALYYLFFFVVLVVAGRGGVGFKPIAIIDAFASGNSAYSNLVMNGVFSISHSALEAEDVNHRFYADDKALEILRRYRTIPNTDYPFQQQANPDSGQRFNLVFLLIESLSHKYVDSFSGNHYGVTPNLDRMARNGLMFSRFFANGQRSVEGIQATLTGIPSIIGLPTIGSGILGKYSKLGELAAQNGYRTIFTTSLKRRSFRLDAMAGSAGFKEFYGMEDIPQAMEYPDPKAARWGWDYDTFMKTADCIEAEDTPFLAYIVTGTTHTPYPKLPKHLEKYPYSADKEGGFLNTVYYTDWGIGQLLERLRKKTWFDHTIFIITADHALAHYQSGDFKGRFQIPLIVYAPKIFRPAIIDTTWSQVDVFSAIIDVLKFKGKYSSLGVSFFNSEQGNPALVREGLVMGVIGNHGYLKHSLKNRLETGAFDSKTPTDYFNQLEQYLLAADQMVFQTLKRNSWAE